jgi:hypothetical protein
MTPAHGATSTNDKSPFSGNTAPNYRDLVLIYLPAHGPPPMENKETRSG